MKISIIITFSKIFAILILVTGSLYSFLNHETSVIIIAISTSTGIILNKQYNDRKKEGVK